MDFGIAKALTVDDSAAPINRQRFFNPQSAIQNLKSASGDVGRLDDDVVDAQRGGRGALQVGERLVVVGLGAQLLVARVDELVLALEEEERGGATDLIEAARARDRLSGARAGLPVASPPRKR